jgi:hypothetical protein
MSEKPNSRAYSIADFPLSSFASRSKFRVLHSARSTAE